MLTPAQRRYVTIETLVGAIINGLFSVLFVFLIFSGQAHVSTAGEQGLLLDSLPQGFAIGFMGAFFPSFLTRKRIQAGNIQAAPTDSSSPLPVMPVLRALLFAVIAAILSVVIFTVLSLLVSSLSFTVAAIIKTLWGVLLGGIVS